MEMYGKHPGVWQRIHLMQAPCLHVTELNPTPYPMEPIHLTRLKPLLENGSFGPGLPTLTVEIGQQQVNHYEQGTI